MNAETAAAWAAWLAAAVTAGSVIIAVRANRHSKDAVAEARRSADAAEKAVIAADKSATEARRSADAAERQAAAAEAMVPPPQPKVAWKASRIGDGYYGLRNVGTDAAVNVTVAAEGYDASGIRVTPAPVRVLAGATVRVFLAGGAESPEVDELQVSWDGQATPVLVELPAD